MKKTVLTLVKLAIVGSALGYLIHSGRLDVFALKVFWKDPLVLFANIGLWIFGAVCLNTLRWQRLLLGMNLQVPVKRVFQMSLTGLFFNTVAPGSVGGDLVKAFYIYREQKKGKGTSALLSILLDRLVGLYCVFLIAAVLVAVFARRFMSTPALQPVALFAILSFLGITAFFVGIYYFANEKRAPLLLNFLDKPFPGFAFIKKVALALFALRDKPLNLLWSILLGLGFQCLFMVFFWLVTYRITGQQLPIADFVAIFPLGFLAIALPIAPGGLGVGHLAFEKLFMLIGLSHGATVFNCVFIGQAALNLLGLIPYLFLKKTSHSSRDKVPLPAN